MFRCCHLTVFPVPAIQVTLQPQLEPLYFLQVVHTFHDAFGIKFVKKSRLASTWPNGLIWDKQGATLCSIWTLWFVFEGWTTRSTIWPWLWTWTPRPSPPSSSCGLLDLVITPVAKLLTFVLNLHLYLLFFRLVICIQHYNHTLYYIYMNVWSDQQCESVLMCCKMYVGQGRFTLPFIIYNAIHFKFLNHCPCSSDVCHCSRSWAGGVLH